MKTKISKTIHALRVLNNYTSKDMAERLAISQGQYSKIESGQKELSLQKLEKVAAALNVNFKDFMEMILNGTILQNPIKESPDNGSQKMPELSTLENIFHPKFIETCRLYLEYMRHEKH